MPIHERNDRLKLVAISWLLLISGSLAMLPCPLQLIVGSLHFVLFLRHVYIQNICTIRERLKGKKKSYCNLSLLFRRKEKKVIFQMVCWGQRGDVIWQQTWYISRIMENNLQIFEYETKGTGDQLRSSRCPRLQPQNLRDKPQSTGPCLPAPCSLLARGTSHLVRKAHTW